MAREQYAFVDHGDGRWDRLELSAFDREIDLQNLVEAHPELLGGAQIDPDDPRRFLLVASEMPVPDAGSSSGRWSLDHLFIDQDAIPTLVEVKRSSDTRIRREVVGQMIDYIANGAQFWDISDLEERLTEQRHTEVVLAEFGVDESWWMRVESNLKRGRVRLLFVADSVPSELETSVEWLNEHLRDAEAFTVEIGHYVGLDGMRCLVPTLRGMSARERKRRNTSDEDLDEILAAAGEEGQQVVERLESFAADADCAIRRTKRGIQLRSSQGTILQYYPKNGDVEFALVRVARDGESGTAVRAAIADIAGKPIAEKYPKLSSKAFLRRWDTVANDVLRPLFDADGVGTEAS